MTPWSQSLFCLLAKLQVHRSLQGLVTKDLEPLRLPAAAPLYTVLLNSKGRFMYDFVCHRSQDSGLGERRLSLLLDCPASALQSLLSLLTRFKLRSNVSLEDASPDWSVVARWTVPTSGVLVSQDDMSNHTTSGAIHLSANQFQMLLDVFSKCLPARSLSLLARAVAAVCQLY
jgi:folate-binding Fe-S cluster repair protein YgfZ